MPCGDTLGKRIQHSGNSDEKGAAEPPIRKKTENKNYKIFQASKKKKAEIQQKTASMSASVCGDTAGVLLLSAVKYFFCLIFQGKKQYAQQNYEEAQRIAEYALDKNPKNEAANLLLAKSMEKSGDKRSALLVLRPFIQNKTAGTGIYKEYVKLLTQEGKTNEVRLILKSADREVQNACAEYICETPVSNPAPGTYTTTQTLKLEGNCQKIYYTLDGSTPTRKSKVYTEPIILREGTTELKAFGVNDKNIESDVISRKYVIVLNAPKAPKVTPKSGDYNKKTEIKITVPDGCKAYYAFDSEPDLNSTVYEQPISMPVGYHRLNVILVAANGKTSKMTAMEYYLQY